MIDDRKFLRQKFLADVRVLEADRGYLSVPSFNLRIEAKVLAAAARLITQYFKDDGVKIVHGIPHSGNYVATAVALEFGDVFLHASRKDQVIPVTWKEVLRREVRSFTTSSGGIDVFAGLNLSFVRKGDRVLLTDDVCGGGETALTLLEGLQERGAKVLGFAVLFDKEWQGGLQRISDRGIKTFSCITVKKIARGDKVELKS